MYFIDKMTIKWIYQGMATIKESVVFIKHTIHTFINEHLYLTCIKLFKIFIMFTKVVKH